MLVCCGLFAVGLLVCLCSVAAVCSSVLVCCYVVGFCLYSVVLGVLLVWILG